MTLIRWEPLTELTTLHKEMDRLWEEFFGTPLKEEGQEAGISPAVDIAETDDALIIKAHVPGVSKEHLHLSLADNMLTLKGEVKEEDAKQKKHFYRREIRYGTFQRTIPLPVSVQADQTRARLKDGVLFITIPKSEYARRKEIPVEVR
ncbi:MAG: Hsp20/alpha crystallin family protein [Nitrospinota bacterium]|nr:MAG: Hsp20/alpha crystallin family protein [Nitrospinota bacterium]